MIVDTFQLGEALGHQPRFIPFNRAIRLMLDFIDPSTTNWYLARRESGKSPSTIGLERRQLRLHCISPFWNSSSFRIRVGFSDSTNLSNERTIRRLVSVIRHIIGQGITRTFGRTWRDRGRLVGENSRTNVIIQFGRRSGLATGTTKNRRVGFGFWVGNKGCGFNGGW